MENDNEMLFYYIYIKMNPGIYNKCKDFSFYIVPRGILGTFGAS